MFRLLRYFSIASAIALITVIIALVYFYRHNELEHLVVSAENQNITLARSFANILWPKFSNYVMTVRETDGDKLRARPETAEIDHAARTLTAGLPVLKVKIYNLAGRTIYSSASAQIGKDKSNNPGFLKSAKAGKPASKLSFRETFGAFSGEVSNRNLVESYLPIWGADNAIEGVFELYTDVTALTSEIDQHTQRLTAALLMTFVLLYGVLFVIVRRADRIMKRQYADQLESQEQLNQQNTSLEREIKERQRAEEGLAEKSVLLETTFENMVQGIAVYDAGHTLVAFNPQYAEILGLPADYLDTGMNRRDIIVYRAQLRHYDEAGLGALVEERLATAKQPESSERTLPNGRSYIYERMPTPDGGYISTVTDITERKRTEDQVRDLNESLEEKVEARTAELKSAQDGLLRAERLAALGQLTGTVAHELRNPLGAVSTTAKTIEHKISEAGLDLGKMFARMDRGIQRCDNIITELLDFARAKGLEAEPTPLDSWLTLTLEEIAIPQAITLHLALDAKGMVLDFDRDRLRRVLINVVDNACQAMDGGDDGELTVTTSAGDGRVVITITDTGPGIPEDILPKIFEPLFSTKQFGVGLGLPTVRQIMEEHGGGFDITNGESKSGKTSGTRATLWLPLALTQEQSERASA